MDMNVSPDLEAYYCYLIVLGLGIVAALSQVSTRLTNLPGKWIMVNTWLLFAAYAAIPIGLFWFLDRTSAIHDTSLFAAVLIGVGYQQILTGGASIRVTGELTKFWQPFAAWADSIAGRIRDRIIVNDSQFDEKLLLKVSGTEQTYNDLHRVVMVHAQDRHALQALLDAIDQDLGLLGDHGVRQRKASEMYLSLKRSSPQQFQYFLYRNGVIPRHWYYWYAREWRSKTTALFIVIVLCALAVTGFVAIDKPRFRADYYIWRFQKQNGSDDDHYRARTQLIAYLCPAVDAQLAGLLMVPTLPVKTADDILSLLFDTRAISAAQHVSLPQLLINALRTRNADVRARIQKVLLSLAQEQKLKVPEDLTNWKPDPKDSSVDVDARVKQWNQVVAAGPQPSARATPAHAH